MSLSTKISTWRPGTDALSDIILKLKTQAKSTKLSRQTWCFKKITDKNFKNVFNKIFDVLK